MIKNDSIFLINIKPEYQLDLSQEEINQYVKKNKDPFTNVGHRGFFNNTDVSWYNYMNGAINFIKQNNIFYCGSSDNTMDQINSFYSLIVLCKMKEWIVCNIELKNSDVSIILNINSYINKILISEMETIINKLKTSEVIKKLTE